MTYRSNEITAAKARLWDAGRFAMIDGLRGIAALAGVLFSAAMWWSIERPSLALAKRIELEVQNAREIATIEPRSI